MQKLRQVASISPSNEIGDGDDEMFSNMVDINIPQVRKLTRSSYFSSSGDFSAYGTEFIKQM